MIVGVILSVEIVVKSLELIDTENVSLFVNYKFLFVDSKIFLSIKVRR